MNARSAEGHEDLVIEGLMARHAYDRVVEILKVELEEKPRDPWLRSMMAEALARSGHEDEARFILAAVADDCAKDGSVARGIAAIKRVARLGSDTSALEARLVSAVHTGAERARGEGSDRPEVDLAGSPLFRDFTPAELAAVVRGLQLLSFDPGDILVTEGQEGHSLFVLVHGTARVWAREPSGRSIPIRTLGVGDFFGEIALLETGERTATVTAATRCEVLELSRGGLDAIGRSHPRVRDVLATACRERLKSPMEARVRGRREAREP